MVCNTDPSALAVSATRAGGVNASAPPHTTREAAARIASARTAIERSFPTVSAEVLAKSIEIPTLGTFGVGDFMGIISGHLAHHVGQINAILQSRGVIPAEGA